MKKTINIILITLLCLVISTIILKESSLFYMTGGGFYGAGISFFTVITFLVNYILTIIFIPIITNFLLKKRKPALIFLIIFTYSLIIYSVTIPFGIIDKQKAEDFNNYTLAINNQDPNYCLKIKNDSKKIALCLSRIAEMKLEPEICDLANNKTDKEKCYLHIVNHYYYDNELLTEDFCDKYIEIIENKKECEENLYKNFLSKIYNCYQNETNKNLCFKDLKTTEQDCLEVDKVNGDPNWCVYYLAIEKNDLGLCNHIPEILSNDSNKRILAMCYGEIAKKQNNIKICNFFSEEELNKFCIESFRY